MKLNRTTISYIFDTLKAASSVNLTNVAIGPTVQVGADDTGMVTMYCEHDVPAMECQAMFINRVSDLKNRLSKLKDNDDWPEMLVDENVEDRYVRSVDIKGGNTKIEFRFSDRKSFEDLMKKNTDDMVYSVKMADSVVPELQRGLSMVRASTVTILHRSGNTTFSIVDDTSQERMTIEADTTAAKLDDIGEVIFAHTYESKTLLTLLRDADTFEVGKRGTLHIKANGFDFYVLEYKLDDDF